MRIQCRNLIIVCDWAIKKDTQILIGTRTKELFVINNDFESVTVLQFERLMAKGYIVVDNLQKINDMDVTSIAPDEVQELLNMRWE